MTNGARKFDQEKAPVTTGVLWRFPRALLEVSKVSQLGADKYEVTLPDNNCLNVENGFYRYANAQGRHLLQRWIDGKWNIETGGALEEGGRRIRHLAQNAWDALMILELELLEEEKATKAATNQPPLLVQQPAFSLESLPTPDQHSPSAHNHSHSVLVPGYIDPKQGSTLQAEELRALLDSAEKSPVR